MWKPLLAGLLLAAAPLSAAIPQSQRDALIAIYNATGGDSWKDHAKWNGPAGSECTWSGVQCDEAQTTVIELLLAENNLRGTLPSSIGSFPDLRNLALFGNVLTGSLPASIGQLTSLQSLSAEHNEFSGTVPREISALSKLVRLGLTDNMLVGPLPPELGNLSLIEEIWLAENRIDGEIPRALGNLSTLKVLDLALNKFSGAIPKELGALSRLESLALSANRLEGAIPPELTALGSLTELRLFDNRLSGGIPTGLAGLSKLELFDVSGNELKGTIPPEIGNLPAVRWLVLSNNDFSGRLPAELFRLSTLEELQLGHNDLEGPLPAGIGGLKSLRWFSVETNRLSGTIPPEIGSLPELRSLELLNNDFEGSIPSEIGNLPNLAWLDLAGNNLTGQIPSSLGSLPNLRLLSLSENRLDGRIPQELGNLTRLESLYLTSNQLTGTIPDSLRNLTKLQAFSVGDNHLTGPIPTWIGELTQLRELYFSSNRFNGVIPLSIGALTALESLYLSDNPLTGSIPREIGNLKRLGYLSLDSTQISGAIPPELWQLDNLVEVRLNDMDLSGSIPPGIGNLRLAVVLFLHNNHLEGSIPAGIGNLSDLEYLSLSGNRLTGTIPAEVGRLSTLAYVGLSHNALRGPVPASIRGLTRLVDGASDFTYNAIFESDAATRDFLARKQWDPDFHHTQTTAPSNLRVTQTTDRSATLEWDLISYTDDDGGYQVVASTSAGGAPAAISTTVSKEIGSVTVRGLQAATTYFFTVAAVTHPHGDQQNLLVSESTAPVSATTTARVTAPAEVVVTESPAGLVQIDGTARNEDSFTLTNFGDASSTITFESDGSFFAYSPQSLVLAGGASQTVRLTSISQPAGTYYGSLAPRGDGVGEDEIVYITLLSVAKPSGTVIAEALSTRIEVAGAPGSDSVGAARFRNLGTAPLRGIVLSDQPWVVPNPNPITIDPGSISTVNFTVVRSRRPAGVEGALSANLSLVYVDGGSGGFEALQSGSSGISVTLVTVVDTSKPSTNAGALPGLGSGEVALFGAGLASFVRANNQYVSDLSLANASGSRSIGDVRLYFTPSNATQTTIATLSSIGSSQSVSLANVVSSVYGTESTVGTLQIRSASWQSLAAQAKLVNLKSNGTYSSDVPLFRSDRSAGTNQATYLTGLRKSATMHTDFYLQETAGAAATARIEMLDPNGTAVGQPQDVSLSAFAMHEMLDIVSSAAVTAIVTTRAGRVAAYARVTDDTSGDTWSIVDWSRVQHFTLTEPLRVLALDSGGGVPRRRRAIRPASDAVTAPLTTEVTLFNPATSEARVKVESGAEVVVGPRKTATITNAGVITPARGQLVVTARMYRTANGTYGAAIPVVSAVAGLRVGQSQRFSGLDDSTAKTVAAATAGTFRTSFGLVETSGEPVSVRASMRLDMGRSLVSAIVSREIKLAPRQQLILPDLVKAIVGDARETELGELHNLSLELEVTEGRGSVMPFVVVTDNGSGDSIVRVE